MPAAILSYILMSATNGFDIMGVLIDGSSVNVRVVHSAGYAEASIQDQGMSIAPDALPHQLYELGGFFLDIRLPREYKRSCNLNSPR